MHIYKRWPGWPNAGARATTPPPQSLGDISAADIGQAFPKGTEHLGAPKSTLEHLQPISMRHTIPPTPLKPLNNSQAFNITSFGLVLLTSLSISLDNTPT